MRDGDQTPRAFGKGLALELRRAEFGHDNVDIASRGRHRSGKRRHDPAQRSGFRRRRQRDDRMTTGRARAGTDEIDLPAGADRLIKDPIGIDHVMVNGKFIKRSGNNLPGAEAGRLLRP